MDPEKKPCDEDQSNERSTHLCDDIQPKLDIRIKTEDEAAPDDCLLPQSSLVVHEDVDKPTVSDMVSTVEPVQVPKVDSSANDGSKISLTSPVKTPVNAGVSPVPACRFLVRLCDGSQFIVPANFIQSSSGESSQKTNNSSDKPTSFPASVPPGIIQVLPSILSEASSVVQTKISSQSDLKSPTSVDASYSNQTDSHTPCVQISAAQKSAPEMSNFMLSNILVQLQPLSPSHCISPNTQTVGPTSPPGQNPNKPTFLITVGAPQPTQNLCTTTSSQSSELDATQKTEMVKVKEELDANDDEEISSEICQDELADKAKGELSLKLKKGKKKKRGRKQQLTSSTENTDPVQQPLDRLVCLLCPEPRDDLNDSGENLNCNEVGPQYGIRITNNISRCFVCNVELKFVRDVWMHAETSDHRLKVHNLLTDPSKNRRAPLARNTSSSKSPPTPIKVEPGVVSTDEAVVPEQLSTEFDPIKNEDELKSSQDPNSKTSPSTPTKVAESNAKAKNDDEKVKTPIKISAIELNYDNLNMPTLTEERLRSTRKRSNSTIPPIYAVPKRKRNSSEAGSDSLPVLEKITTTINGCPVCQQEFEDILQKLNHTMSEHQEMFGLLETIACVIHSAKDDEQLLACKACKKVYNGIENLLNHLIAAHQIRPVMLESVETAKAAIDEILSKKQKATETVNEEKSSVVKAEPPEVDSGSSHNLSTTCGYCHRTYTSVKRLQSHFKATDHQRLIRMQNVRQSKKCPHCHKMFKSAPMCAFHLQRTTPTGNGQPCKGKPRAIRAAVEDKSSKINGKKAIVRVPGGGINPSVKPNVNLTCQYCNEVFSTVHTYHLHNRTTSPTKSGCVPVTPNFRAGGGKPILNLDASSSDSSKLDLQNSTLKQETPMKSEAESLDYELESDTGVVTCKYCRKKFNSVKSFKIHKSKTYPNESRTDCISKYIFGKNQDQFVSDNGNKTCDYCGKEFASVLGRRMHNKLTVPNLDDRVCFRPVKHNPLLTKKQIKSISLSEPVKKKWKRIKFDATTRKTEDNANVPVSNDISSRCRVCSKILSTPWNRNAHERNVHNYSADPNTKRRRKSSTKFQPTEEQSDIDQSKDDVGDEGTHCCISCGRSYTSLNKLLAHYNITKHGIYGTTSQCLDDDDSIVCKYCGTAFSSEWTLNMHYRSTLPDRKSGKCVVLMELKGKGLNKLEGTTCKICRKSFRSVWIRYRHENTVHRKELLESLGKNEIEENLDDESSARKMNPCSYCHEKFRSVDLLSKHYKETGHYSKLIDLAANMLECRNCGEAFSSSDQLMDHEEGCSSSVGDDPTSAFGGLAVRNQAKLKKCRFCNAIFTKVMARMEHELQNHEDEMKSIGGTKLVNTESDEQLNSGSVSDNLPLIESVSGATDSSKKSHLHKSGGVSKAKPRKIRRKKFNPLQCVMCLREYSTVDRLQQHYKVTNHNDAVLLASTTDDFTCDVCAKPFKSLRALRIHSRVTIPDERLGICQNKVKLELNQLESEDILQNRSETKVCKFCSRQFTTSWHRKVHEIGIHRRRKVSEKFPVKGKRAKNVAAKESVQEDEIPESFKSKYMVKDSDGKLTNMDRSMKEKLCRVCHRVFYSIWNMRNHVRLHHPDKYDELIDCNSSDERDDRSLPIICKFGSCRSKTKKNDAVSSQEPASESANNVVSESDTSADPLNMSEGPSNTDAAPEALPSANCETRKEDVIKSADDNKKKAASQNLFRLRCPSCTRRFKWNLALKEHQKNCDVDSLQYKCRICGVMFRDRRQLGPHWRKHRSSNQGLTKCSQLFIHLDQQNKQSPAKSPRSKVNQRARMQGRYVNRTVSRNLLKKANQEKSTSNTVGGKQLACYRCAGCNKIFMNAVKFIQHRLGHFSESSVTEISDKKPFCCEVCNMVLQHHTLVQVHLLEHLRVERRKTFYTHNQFLKPGALQKPESPPSPDPTVSSPSYDKNADELQNATPVQKSADEDKAMPAAKVFKRYVCSFCKRNFTSVSRFRHHKKIAHSRARKRMKEQVWKQLKQVHETGQFCLLEQTVPLVAKKRTAAKKKDEESNDSPGNRKDDDLNLLANGNTGCEKGSSSPNNECNDKSVVDSASDVKDADEITFVVDHNSEKEFDKEVDVSASTDGTNKTAISEVDSSASFNSNANNSASYDDYENVIKELSENFTELLGLLLGDEALLLELGWKKRPISSVLEDVLERTGLNPVRVTNDTCALDCLRENIRLMLSESLEDSVQETVGLQHQSIDIVVQNMLKLSEN